MLVQKLRLQRGWSQEQLADLSGLSVRTIQRIERGHSASVETLKCLGAVFDVDFSTLKEPDMTSMSNVSAVTAEEALALAQVRRIKGFYIHLAQWFVTSVVLIALNLYFYPGYGWFYPYKLWAVWVAVGWGSGVAVHGLKVFDKVPFLSGQWERSQVEKYLGRKL